MKRVWLKGPYNLRAPPTHDLEHKYHMITNMSKVVGIKPFRAFQTSSNPTHERMGGNGVVTLEHILSHEWLGSIIGVYCEDPLVKVLHQPI
jgi:hypothetical protein